MFERASISAVASCCRASVPTSSSPIHRTTFRSMDMSAGSAASAIASSPWGSARCLRHHLDRPHNTGRRARLVEFDPAYCDQIVRRFEQVTGKQAKLAATGQRFEVVAEERGLSLVPSTSEENVP